MALRNVLVPRRLPQFGDVVEYPLRDIEMQDGRTAGVRMQCLTKLAWDVKDYMPTSLARAMHASKRVLGCTAKARAEGADPASHLPVSLGNRFRGGWYSPRRVRLIDIPSAGIMCTAGSLYDGWGVSGAGGFGRGAQHGPRRCEEAAARAARPVRDRATAPGGGGLRQVRPTLLIIQNP